MAKQDYYTVLGLRRGASEGDIKKAYRRMAMKYHPDRNQGDTATEERFKEVKEAYEVLSDANRRKMYDQFGHAGLNAGAGGSRGGSQGNFSDIFSDIFGDVFGGGVRGGGQQVHRGSDLRYNMELTLEQAIFGHSTTIRVPKLIVCQACRGTGAKEGSKPRACGACGGDGQIRIQQGFFSVQQTCPQCRGAGQVITDPCRTCRGQGRVKEEKSLSIKIPPGVDTGDRIRLPGEGEAGARGAESGDLYVQVAVIEHEIFKRDGDNLYCEIPISFEMAVLGGEFEVPTLHGRVKLKIPQETQSNRLFRLKGKGVKPARGGATGDLLCRVVVETPVQLDRDQKDRLTQWAVSLSKEGDKHIPQAKRWFDGAKQFFHDSG